MVSVVGLWVIIEFRFLEACLPKIFLDSKVNINQPIAKVKVNISHHELKDGGIKRVKELVFVLDEPESNRKKKKKTVTAKNLGSFMNIPKLKANDTTMELTWRCRRWMG